MDFKIHYQDLEIEIEVIYHQKRNIKLGVYKDLKVKIFCSRNTPKNILESFIDNKKDWIIKHFTKFNEKKIIEDEKFTDNSPFRFLGKEYTLRYINRDKNYIEFYNEFIILASNKQVNKEIAQAALTEWLSAKAKEFFPEIVNRYLLILSEYGLSINTLKIRPMKTRWGTCNKQKKVITLNSYLMHEPIQFIEYVVLHELCHLKYANHSNKFYDFVAKFMPDWKERRKLNNKNIEED